MPLDTLDALVRRVTLVKQVLPDTQVLQGQPVTLVGLEPQVTQELQVQLVIRVGQVTREQRVIQDKLDQLDILVQRETQAKLV